MQSNKANQIEIPRYVAHKSAFSYLGSFFSMSFFFVFGVAVFSLEKWIPLIGMTPSGSHVEVTQLLGLTVKLFYLAFLVLYTLISVLRIALDSSHTRIVIGLREVQISTWDSVLKNTRNFPAIGFGSTTMKQSLLQRAFDFGDVVLSHNGMEIATIKGLAHPTGIGVAAAKARIARRGEQGIMKSEK